jgi:hypothetical protein
MAILRSQELSSHRAWPRSKKRSAVPGVEGGGSSTPAGSRSAYPQVADQPADGLVAMKLHLFLAASPRFRIQTRRNGWQS